MGICIWDEPVNCSWPYNYCTAGHPTNESAKQLLHSDTDSFEIVFYAFLSLIGIVGNSAVLYVYKFKEKAKRQAVIYLISNLAVIDLLMCLLMMPATLMVIAVLNLGDYHHAFFSNCCRQRYPIFQVFYYFVFLMEIFLNFFLLFSFMLFNGLAWDVHQALANICERRLWSQKWTWFVWISGGLCLLFSIIFRFNEECDFVECFNNMDRHDKKCYTLFKVIFDMVTMASLIFSFYCYTITIYRLKVIAKDREKKYGLKQQRSTEGDSSGKEESIELQTRSQSCSSAPHQDGKINVKEHENQRKRCVSFNELDEAPTQQGNPNTTTSSTQVSFQESSMIETPILERLRNSSSTSNLLDQESKRDCQEEEEDKWLPLTPPTSINPTTPTSSSTPIHRTFTQPLVEKIVKSIEKHRPSLGRISKRSPNRRRSQSVFLTSNLKMQGQIAKVAVLVFVAFLISVFPTLVLQHWTWIDLDYVPILRRSYYLNSVLNPIIYSMTKTKFRSEFVGLVAGLLHKKRGRARSLTSRGI